MLQSKNQSSMATQLTISKWAINAAIMAFEVGWDKTAGFSYYNKKLRKPVVPAPDTTSSGVTIGIGYDCGQYSAAKIRADWGSVLPLDSVNALCKCAGLKKQAAVAMLPSRKNVDVPIESALQVFYNTTIFEFAKLALKIYPDLPKIHPVEIAVIISLVYNRGADLTGNRRKEMRDLVAEIKADDDKAMADSIRQMCRLWPNVAGLRRRRMAEADLIALPDTPIADSDKLIINV